MNKIKLYAVLVLLFVIIYSCENSKAIQPNKPEIVEYLHLGHTRTNTNPNMDSIVENIDYTKYEMLWLGGDLTYLTSQDDETMNHVDSIFNLADPNTLWALGNHDYSDLERIQSYTNRLPYYSYHKNGITFIVVDTQDSSSSIGGNQRTFFENIIDTMQESSHLVILHHKLIWMYDEPSLESQLSTIPNGGYGSCSYCINPNNFNSEIYPNLIKLKKRRIETICIGGDIGVKVKEFEYVTDDGIYFLASGIKAGDENNKGLVFTHDITNETLLWEFKPVIEL
jgi:hypothetical protein